MTTLQDDSKAIESQTASPVASVTGDKKLINRKRWYWYLWDAFGKDPAGEQSLALMYEGPLLITVLVERRLLLKLDASLLIFSVLGLLIRYIDQTNLSTAFVSGMK